MAPESPTAASATRGSPVRAAFVEAAAMDTTARAATTPRGLSSFVSTKSAACGDVPVAPPQEHRLGRGADGAAAVAHLALPRRREFAERHPLVGEEEERIVAEAALATRRVEHHAVALAEVH